MNNERLPDTQFIMDWVSGRPWFVSGQTSVMTAGSYNDLPAGGTLSSDSDLDLWCFHLETELPRQEKCVYEGTVFEACHFNIGMLGPNSVTDYQLAPNLISPTILADPYGKIAENVHRVKAEYRDIEAISARLEAVTQDCRMDLSRYAEKPESTLDLLLGSLSVPNCMLIASCERPTFRKAFAQSKSVCRKWNLSVLYQDLLGRLRFRELDPERVRNLLDMCVRILNESVKVKRSNFWGDFEIQPFRISQFELHDLAAIEEGMHTEMVLHILFMAYWGMLPIWMDADESATEEQQGLYDQILHTIGWHTPESRQGVAGELLEFHNEHWYPACVEVVRQLKTAP